MKRKEKKSILLQVNLQTGDNMEMKNNEKIAWPEER